MSEETGNLDAAALRADFPIFSVRVHGRRLVYLDSAATSQRPACVLEAMDRFYRERNAGVRRALHELSVRATEAYEESRAVVGAFIGAHDARTIVFTRNATEAINLVAHGWGRKFLEPGDEIALTRQEHHSNLLPWQAVAREKGARLRFVDLDPSGRLLMRQLRDLLASGRVKLVAAPHVSNVLGVVNPVREIAEAARAAGAAFLVDGAQAAGHLPVDVTDIGCDFYAFSGHKMLGPTGIGVLYGRIELLDRMDPLLCGGEMVSRVAWDSSVPAEPPHRFEGGTPNAAGAVGLAAAVRYLQGIGMARVRSHEARLLSYALDGLGSVPEVRILGPREDRSAVVAFLLGGVHPHDIAQVLDGEGIAIRAGHHCAQPLHEHLGLTASARASVSVYNDEADIDALVAGVRKVRGFFGTR